jgi:hypothetical protein
MIEIWLSKWKGRIEAKVAEEKSEGLAGIDTKRKLTNWISRREQVEDASNLIQIETKKDGDMIKWTKCRKKNWIDDNEVIETTELIRS